MRVAKANFVTMFLTSPKNDFIYYPTWLLGPPLIEFFFY